MGSELKVRVSDQELEYRSKNHRDIRAIEQRQLTCCSCGNVLSQESGRVYSHPIFGILQCENCKNHFRRVTFNLEKDDSVRVCHICGRERKHTYGCKKQDCPYEYCKNCIKRTIPKSLVDAESGKWKCFACNTQPLWKLRGACAAIMYSLPKRTKTKKVKSRNRSSDSEDDTSNLRNISYVKRNRLVETEKLKKRLNDVCDDESPTQADEPPQLQVIRRQKHVNPDQRASSTADHASRASKNIPSSSDDSDLEEIKISKPKVAVKSQSKHRVSKNDRTGSTHRKPRDPETHGRSVVIALSSDDESDDESELGRGRDSRNKSKSHAESSSTIKGKRNERSSKSASAHGKGASRETMPSTRKSRNAKEARKKVASSGNDSDSGDSSSDDSDSRAIKDLRPLLFAKDKSREKKKPVAPRTRKDSEKEEDEEEAKNSRDRSKGGVKSLASKSSNVSSKSGKNSKSRDPEEEENDDDNATRKTSKKPLVKSPGPKSFKDGTKPRRENLSTLNEEDSDHSVTRRSTRDKQNRKAENADENEKSVGQRLLANNKQASDSSSGKEFKAKKLLRPSFVALRRIRDLEEDFTTAAVEELPEDEAAATVTKEQTYVLKNAINNFYTELKIAATMLLNDVEQARRSYSRKDRIRVDEANRMVLETKNLVKKFRDSVDKSDTRVTDNYDKWCAKTRVKNVLRRSARAEEKPSTSDTAVEAKTAEESGSECSTKSNVTAVSKPEGEAKRADVGKTLVVVSECDSEDIFSADESRKSINRSKRRDSEAAGKNDDDDEAPKAGDNQRSGRSTPDEAKNVVDSSDKETSEPEAKRQSPTMSEFSGRSDNDIAAENEKKRREKSALPACEDNTEPMDTASDTREKENSMGESDKEEKNSGGTSLKNRRVNRIKSSTTVLASDSESEGLKRTDHLDLSAETVGDFAASPETRKNEEITSNAMVPDSDAESEALDADSSQKSIEAAEPSAVVDSESEECVTPMETSRVVASPEIHEDDEKIRSNATVPESGAASEASREARDADSANETNEVEETAVERKVKSAKSSDASAKRRKTRRSQGDVSARNSGSESEGSKKTRDANIPSESTGDKEIPAVDSETEKSKAEMKKSTKSSAKTRKTRGTPSVAAANGSDGEAEVSKKARDAELPNESTADKDISAVDSETESPKTEKTRKPRKIKSVAAVNDSDGGSDNSKKTEAVSRRRSKQPDSESGEKSNEETSSSGKKRSKSKKKDSTADKKPNSENDERKEREEEEASDVAVSYDIASVSTEVLSLKSVDEKDDDIGDSAGETDADETMPEEPNGSMEPVKKIDDSGRSDTPRRSSSETAILENMSGRETSPASEVDSDASAEIVTESQNKAAQMALLASSNSDDSTSDERVERDERDESDFPARDSNDAPPTPPESDSKSESNLANDDLTTERESNERTRKKRSKLRLTTNRHYLADPKLKLKCEVRVERLKKKILRRYSRALKQSGEYVESKNLKRLVKLDKLGKDQKKASVDTTDDEDKSSSKDLKRKKSKSRAAKETLLDHLNKVDNGEAADLGSNSDAESSTTTGNKEKADDNDDNGDDRLLAEANRMAKKRLLESSDSNAEEEEQPASDAKDEKNEKNEKDEKKKKKVKQAAKKEKLDKSSDNEEEKQDESDKNRWRKNKILTSKISDSDSEEEIKKFNKSQEKVKEKKKKGSHSDSDEEEAAAKKSKKKRVRRRVLHSDSDAVVSSEKNDSDSESSAESIKKKKKKKKKAESSEDDADKKKTRKRTRRGRKGSDSSDSDDRPKPTRRKRIKKVAGSDSDSDNDPDSQSPGKAGRKNIRKVLRDKQVAEDTKQAAKEEEERLKRIAERQKLYNEMYEVRLAGEEKVDKLVLDFDEETKEPLVSVEESLVKRLKPHQAQGIKFMWDACFESLERIKSTKGSGCILAHCMGLGKSFQVVTLAHTLLSHEETGIKTILVVCPLSTVLNWANEFKIWLADVENVDDIEVYEMTKMKKNFERKFQLARWQETGGVMIIGYEMFRNLTQPGKKVRKNIQETFLKCLVDPGPDLIVCDEGHLLKNEDTALSKAMRRVKTLRRVVLTGTPLQNNLIEYHCMVQFVKPNLLGTKKEFMNRFENPITNGQFDDSTEYDVKLMKKRAHILHKLLEGSVQRFDYSVLTPFLPPKQEYVIFVKLTKIQIDMYRHYLDNYARSHRGVGGSLFADFQALQRIWTHPMVMQMNAEKVERANEKKRLDASDTEGSLKDFIDDDSDTPCTTNSSGSGSDDQKIKKTTSKRSTRANPVVEEPAEDDAAEAPEEAAANDESQWWTQYVKEEDYEDIRCSSKLLILFRIIKESEQIGDKLLVFSQSLYSLTLIEKFLQLIDEETQKGQEPETLDGHSGSWSLGLDYFRLDGQTSADNRRRWCEIFNRSTNTRARLFLISTRAGGLGINLTAANRVVIFDASWNPSHDVQSIFRIYRFGQKKPCYVYRLLAAGTMEEKIYNRQVTKLSLSCRVVDEQQIERHYSNNALAELYQLELPSETEQTLNLPKDRLLAEIFSKYKNSVENYHEHDSLLENQAGEELDEEERQQAWVEYEEEKKGKRVMPPMAFNYQDPMLMQQINLLNMGAQNMAVNNPAMLADYQNLQRLMEKDYPGIPEAQQKMLASRAVFEMYNYVEKQAMSSHGAVNIANLAGMTNMANMSNMPNIQNMAALQGGYNNQMGQGVNQGQSYMDMLRLQQQQQQQQALLQQQQHNGQIKYATNQQQLRADILRQQQQLYAQAHQQKPYAQKQQQPLLNQAQSSSASAPITIDDDDIMEVIASADLVPAAPAVDPSPKNKEE